MKYLIACPIYGPPVPVLKRNMDFLAKGIGREPIHHFMEPHLTLHPPVTAATLPELKKLVEDLAKEMEPITVRTGASQFFGIELLVLPVQGLQFRLAKFWTHVHDWIFQLTGQKGEYDDENTLHITLINKLTSLDSDTREGLAKLVVYPIPIPLSSLAIYERVYEGPAKWVKKCEVKFG